MSGYEEYLNKKEGKNKGSVYKEQRERTLDKTVEDIGPKDINEFKEKYDRKFSGKDDLKTRTQYYFNDSLLLRAKATRYKNIQNDYRTLEAYSSSYSNHSTSKRQGYASDASKKFEEAARLENEHASEVALSGQQEKKDFALFRHREEVIRKRLEGMEYAAMLKSRSDEDETYRKLKAEYSCLKILLEQLGDIRAVEQTERDARKLDAAKVRIESELQGVERQLSEAIPAAYQKQMTMHGERMKKDLDNAGSLTTAASDLAGVSFERMKNAMAGRQVGTDTKTFHDLSVFLTGNADSDRQLLDYWLGTGINDKTGKIKGMNKNAAMDMMANRLLSLDLRGIDLATDDKLVKSAKKLEEIFNCTAAFNRFMEKNPTYMELLPEEKKRKVTDKLDELKLVSGYYVTRKEILTDEEFLFKKPAARLLDITKDSTGDQRALAQKLIKSNVLARNFVRINTGVMPPLKTELKFVTDEAKEYYNQALQADNDEELRNLLEKAYTSMDHLAGGIIINPYEKLSGKGDRYKFHMFIGHEPMEMGQDPEMIKGGEKKFRAQKKKRAESVDKDKRPDYQTIVDTITRKFGNLKNRDTGNPYLNINLTGMNVSRIMPMLTLNTTANMTTNEIIDMLSGLLAPGMEENRNLSADSDKVRQLNQNFLKALTTYKGIVLNSLRSFVGTMGNMMTQVRPEELNAVFCICGDVLKEYMNYAQDAGIMLKSDVNAQFINTDRNEEDRELQFLSDYMSFVAEVSQSSQLGAIGSLIGKKTDANTVPDYMGTYLEQLKKIAIGQGREFYRQDFENSKYITGPSQSAAGQQAYMNALKKTLSEKQLQDFVEMRTLFSKESAKKKQKEPRRESEINTDTIKKKSTQSEIDTTVNIVNEKDLYSDDLNIIKEEKKGKNIQTGEIKEDEKNTSGIHIKPASEYEKQGYNNCFGCSGAALLNRFILNEDGKLDKPYGQMDLRDYHIPGFKTFEEIGDDAIDEALYNDTLSKILNRVGQETTDYNSIFELADFFVTKRKDVAVNRMRFYMPQYRNDMTGREKADYRDLKEEMTDRFLDKVKDVLKTGNFVSVLKGNHYVTITGIDGKKLKVLDSLVDEDSPYRDVTKPLTKSADEILAPVVKNGKVDNTTEICWLSKIDNPQELADKFDNLHYSEQEGFTSDNEDVDTKLLLAQTKGVNASKSDPSQKIGDRIITSVYVPKKSTIEAIENDTIEKSPYYGPLSFDQVNAIRQKALEKKKSAGKINRTEKTVTTDSSKKVSNNTGNSTLGKMSDEVLKTEPVTVHDLLAPATGYGKKAADDLKGLLSMTEIKCAQRKTAFLDNSLFAKETEIKLRDKVYIEAMGEINRRRNLNSSHFSDSTRISRMKSANKIMGEAHDKIDALMGRFEKDKGAGLTPAQKVKALEEIYDSIRRSDRYFAEAISLNKTEETRLKSQAEINCCVSLMSMYEREINEVIDDSRQYNELKRKYDETSRKYEELLSQIPEETAGESIKKDKKAEKKSGDNKSSKSGSGMELVDKEAEDRVSANVEMFNRFFQSLSDPRYVDARKVDPAWNKMLGAAEDLLEDWDEKTDSQRGQCLADVMISANEFLSRGNLKGSVNKLRADAARQFREFFKNTLHSMSMNCRILALDEIYSKTDLIENHDNYPDELKKLNRSVFSEMSKELYISQGNTIDEEKEKVIDDDYYRINYVNDKILQFGINVSRIFGGTKEFHIANLKFKLSRSMSCDQLSDSFRVDRFGRVLKEDEGKKEKWKELIHELAFCDTQKALNIQRRWFARIANIPIDKELATKKGLKEKLYDLIKLANNAISMQNLGSDWKMMREKEIKEGIESWNKANPDDRISEKEIIYIDREKLEEQRKKLMDLPLYKAIGDYAQALGSDGFMYNYYMNKGLEVSAGSAVSVQGARDIRLFRSYYQFVKDGKKTYYMDGATITDNIIHKDGSLIDVEQDTVGSKGMLRQNAQNPIVLKYVYKADLAKELLNKNSEIFKSAPDIAKKLEIRNSRLFTVETSAMDRLRTLCTKNLDAAGIADLSKLETLFDEFIREASAQIVAKEKLEESEMKNARDGSSEYFKKAKEYELQKKNMNRLFEGLEKAQKDFLLKYAKKGDYEKWKEELEEKRKASRIEEQHCIDGIGTYTEKAIRAFEDKDANMLAEGFTQEEKETIQQYYRDRNLPFNYGNIERVLNTFIRPVRRDFLGAPLTEKDRYNAEFNMRFRKAVIEHDSEQLKEISREFTQNVLTDIPEIAPEEYENMDPETLYKRVCKSDFINYLNIKLSMLSCVQKDSYNVEFPELKVGLEELKGKDKEKYDAIMRILNHKDLPIAGMIMRDNGFDLLDHKYVGATEKKSGNPMLQMAIGEYRTEYASAHETDIFKDRFAKAINIAANSYGSKQYNRMVKAMTGLKRGSDPETFHDLSVFLTGNEQEDKAFVNNYLGFVKDKNTGAISHPDRRKAYDQMTARLLKIQPAEIELTGEAEVSESANKLEEIVSFVGAYERMLKRKPEYLKESKDKDAIKRKLSELRDAANKYLITKVYFNDEYYRTRDDKLLDGYVPEELKEGADNLIRDSYERRDYLVNGISVDPNNLNLENGDLNKLKYFTGLLENGNELKKKSARSDVETIDKEVIGFMGNTSFQNVQNSRLGVAVPGFVISRTISLMHSCTTAFMGTDEVIEMLNNMHAPNLPQNQKLDPNSEEAKEVDRKFIEAVKNYKKVIYYSFKCLVGTFGKLPLQLSQSDFRKFLHQYGDILANLTCYIQDITCLMENEKSNLFFDFENDPKDKELKFITYYLAGAYPPLKSHHAEMEFEGSMESEELTEKVVNAFRDLRSSDKYIREAMSGPIETNPYLKGPSFAGNQQIRYDAMLKKNMSEKEYALHMEGRKMFDK